MDSERKKVVEVVSGTSRNRATEKVLALGEGVLVVIKTVVKDRKQADKKPLRVYLW